MASANEAQGTRPRVLRDDEPLLWVRGVDQPFGSGSSANQVLFNLSEVYGAEQRYVDQLELLRTVGRPGSRAADAARPGRLAASGPPRISR